MTPLGRLEKVDLRKPWPTEAQHFTPWLASEDNIPLLAETLGLELEVEAVERSVGPFRADILCKDMSNNAWVLIENQLERTDHTHLGQLITYAAGLDAVTIVWIADRVADEHRKAIDWLNEITSEEVRFFALEIELWRIGDSPAAPKFNIVCQPNDWARSTTSAKRAIAEGDLSPLRQKQRDYWQGLQDHLKRSSARINPVKPQAQSWISHGIGRSGFSLNVAMNTRDHWVRVEVYVSGPTAKGYFALLEQDRAEIEQAIGAPLDWQRLDDKRDCRICLALEGVDLLDEADWPRQHAWLVDKMNLIHSTFAPLIRELDQDAAEALS